MTMSPSLQRLLARLRPTDHLKLSTLEEAISDSRYTGTTTIHWLNGRPRQVDLGAPVRLSIVEGGAVEGAPQPRLDKPGSSGTS